MYVSYSDNINNNNSINNINTNNNDTVAHRLQKDHNNINIYGTSTFKDNLNKRRQLFFKI